MSEGRALLISWLRFAREPLPDRYVPRAITVLTEIKHELAAMKRPADAEEIVQVLSMTAATLQVELPEEDGIVAYVAVLQDVPQHVLHMAMKEILRTHSYRTLPLPSEFLATPSVVAWKSSARWLDYVCDTHLRKLQRRLDAAAPRLSSGSRQSQNP